MIATPLDGEAIAKAPRAVLEARLETIAELPIDGRERALVEATRIELELERRAELADLGLRTTDTITDPAGVIVERTFDAAGELVDQRCLACRAQLVDDDRGPFYDAVTDDGTPHACPARA